MFFLLKLAVFTVFLCVWYLPLYIKHRHIVGNSEKKRHYLYAFLLGFVAFVVSFLCQFAGGILVHFLLPNGFSNTIANEIFAFIKLVLLVGIVEELTKFFAGKLAMRGAKDLSEAGCMLIMGMAGVGFETFETLLGTSDIISVIIRCITALHVFWQLYMGKHWWLAMREKNIGNIEEYKKERAKAFLVPIVTHVLFDYPVLKVGQFAEKETESIALPLLMVAFILVLAIVLVVSISIMAYRTIKQEKLDALAGRDEAAPDTLTDKQKEYAEA